MRQILALLLGLALCLAASPAKKPVVALDGHRSEYMPVDVAKLTKGQPEVVPMSDVEKKWDRMEKKAAAMKEATDKLAAALRVVASLRSKKKQADDEFAKQAHRYAHEGAHPTDHKKDAKTPLDLEVASAQKNVMDLRFNRAKAQAELLRRTAVDVGAITGAAAAQTAKDDAESVGMQAKKDKKQAKKVEKEAQKARIVEKQALKDYQEFKKHTIKTKLLEKKLASQKAVQQALSRSAAGAQNAKLREKRTKLQVAAVEAQTAQTAAAVGKQDASVLVYKKLAQDSKHQQQVAALKEQLVKSRSSTKAETKRADEATSALRTLQNDSNQEKELKQELKRVKP